MVFLLGVVTSGPDNRPGDSLIFDLWPSPDAFWLSLALAFSLPGLQGVRINLFSFMVRDRFCTYCCLQIVQPSVSAEQMEFVKLLLRLQVSKQIHL